MTGGLNLPQRVVRGLCGIEIVPIDDHPLAVVTALFCKQLEPGSLLSGTAPTSARRARLVAEMATGGNAAGLDMC